MVVIFTSIKAMALKSFLPLFLHRFLANIGGTIEFLDITLGPAGRFHRNGHAL